MQYTEMNIGDLYYYAGLNKDVIKHLNYGERCLIVDVCCASSGLAVVDTQKCVRLFVEVDSLSKQKPSMESPMQSLNKIESNIYDVKYPDFIIDDDDDDDDKRKILAISVFGVFAILSVALAVALIGYQALN